MALECRKGIVYGYRHMGARTHPKVGVKPKSDPPGIVPCPTCLVSVLATKHRYWEPDETLHEHQPARYGVSEEEASDIA